LANGFAATIDDPRCDSTAPVQQPRTIILLKPVTAKTETKAIIFEAFHVT